MISRRRLLAMSVTMCGCATCGGIGMSAFAQSAGADSSTAIKGAGYDMWFIGAQRETIMNGKLAAALDLKTWRAASIFTVSALSSSFGVR